MPVDSVHVIMLYIYIVYTGVHGSQPACSCHKRRSDVENMCLLAVFTWFETYLKLKFLLEATTTLLNDTGSIVANHQTSTIV